MIYKEFELILSSFKCNKNCPYCTAKITKWPVVDDKIGALENKLKELKEKEIYFKYFIFCGNGEPSLHSFDTIKRVVDATRKINIFEEKRFQSSGNIFFEPEKLNLIKNDFTIEITRVDFDSKKDMQILGYNQDYINSEAFKTANIRLNYVLMKNKSFDTYLTEIKKYIDTYPSIKTVSLKTLNLNTLNGKIDNPYSQWIINNALTKKDAKSIIEFMNKHANIIHQDKKFFDRIEWNYKGVPITFYVKKLSYGVSNVVCYGGELVDYHLNKLSI
jgi:hypothetical protein